MIIVVTEWDEEDRKIVSSHGYDTTTGRNIILPQIHPSELNSKWNNKVKEWVIEDWER